MDALTPLETLYDTQRGSELPLPPELATVYGQLQFPLQSDRPYVIANFVTSLDGVASLETPGRAGGGDISGNNKHDHIVMGILRAVSDAIIVGAGTQRKSPKHIWTAEHIYPSLAGAYQQLRRATGKTTPPLNVIATTEGNIDLSQPLFQSGKVPVLIVTTTRGEQRVREQAIPPSTKVVALTQSETLSAQSILNAVQQARQCDLILTEGGPTLLGDFLIERRLDELFLTLAPQIAGRDTSIDRPGLVAGQLFAPGYPLWGTLLSVKRETSHLFLRYAFDTK
ncbi:MAG TPA: dihydrofolate reductase family protein [Ktedonobacteraceae bacterium]|nr:dihydrofolate reductase family protein [Ktedonobacteraceae bacterium]